MKVIKAFRYELKPNNRQRTSLIKHSGVARFAWNWALAKRIELYRTGVDRGKFTNANVQNRELNILKKNEFNWMYEVSKCAPQEALRDLDKCCAKFFRNAKKKVKYGHPKFKKKNRKDSFRITCGLYIKGNSIKLPKVGLVRLKENAKKFKGHILSATVSREADRWFVSITTECNIVIGSVKSNKIVGIDLGLKQFATIYDGEMCEELYSPKPLTKLGKRLRRVSRAYSSKKIGSKNCGKAKLRLSKLYRRIRCIRRDYIAKLSSSLAKTKSVIVMEDLAVANMVRNRSWSGAIIDVGWGNFRRMLEYKTQWYGSRLIIIGRFEPTSKTCSECGSTNKDLTLSDRRWVCESCGTVHDRDVNAAKNIRNLGIKILNTEGSSGINACGVDVRPQLIGAVDGEAGNKQDKISDKSYGTVDYQHPFITV